MGAGVIAFADYTNRVAFRGERFVLMRGKKAVESYDRFRPGKRPGELPELLSSLPRLGACEAERLAVDLQRVLDSRWKTLRRTERGSPLDPSSNHRDPSNDRPAGGIAQAGSRPGRMRHTADRESARSGESEKPARGRYHRVRSVAVHHAPATEERFTDLDRADFHENWVMIRHTDGTIGRYIHLTQNGALVELGDTILQGQKIGLSGNSGPSTGPHLHFDVQTCGPNLPPGYNRLPCGRTVPVSFRNTEGHSCGVVPGRPYLAQGFTPDRR